MRKLILAFIVLMLFGLVQALPAQPRDWPEERFPLASGAKIIVNYCEGYEQAMTDSGCRSTCFVPGKACYHNYQTGCWECHGTAEVREAKISGYCKPGKGKYYSQQGCQADCLEAGQACYYHYPNNCWQCRNKDRIDTDVDCEDQANVEDCKYYYPVTEQNMDDFKDRLRGLYVQGLSELPEMGRSMIGNDIVNVIVDQELGLYILTSDSSVSEVGVGHKEEATLILHLEEETVEKILRGETRFVDTLKTRDSYFEGVGIFNTIKLILINFLLLLS
jgi:hypothetical protein